MGKRTVTFGAVVLSVGGTLFLGAYVASGVDCGACSPSLGRTFAEGPVGAIAATIVGIGLLLMAKGYLAKPH